MTKSKLPSTIPSNPRTGKLSHHFAHASKMVLLTLCALLSFSCRHENAPTASSRTTFSVSLLSVSRDNIFSDGEDSPALSASRVLGKGCLLADGEGVPADITLEQANMSDLWVFEGTTLLAHQHTGDRNFGSPQVELSYGHHTITFVASPQPDQTFTAGVWSAPKAIDCFGYVADIDVSAPNSSEPIVLNRISYGLKWQSTDLVPTTATTLRLHVSPMYESLSAGLIGTNGYERIYTYDITSYHMRPISVTIYGLPEHYATEGNISTTIEFLDASDNILFTHTTTVPVLSNRRTIITAPLFNSSASSSIRINSQWLTDYETTL